MEQLWSFASEAEGSSSVAEVLKAAADWTESLEMGCEPRPLWGRTEASAGWRGHCTSYNMGFLGPQKKLRWKDQCFCTPSTHPSGGNHASHFPKSSRPQGRPQVQADRRDTKGEDPRGVDGHMPVVGVN